MNSLPEIHVLFPQPEPEIWTRCISCEDEICEGEEFIEVAGYHYCNGDCYMKLAIKEGNAVKRVAGE